MMAHAVFSTRLNQLIIKEFLLQIGRFYTDSDRVTKVIDDTRTLSDYPVMFLVEFEEV